MLWRHQFGNISNPALRAPEMHADGNALSNLLEYALDLRAGEPVPSLFQYGVEVMVLRLRYTRNKAAVGLT
jgi:hypothetical protein